MNLDTPIAKGNTAEIYLYEGKIIKIFNDNLPDTESQYEANKQKHAHSCGLSVPKVLDVTKVDGKQAIIMEHMKGKTLGDLLSEQSGQVEYYMRISVDIQQKIHKVIPGSTLEPMSEKLHRQIVSCQHLDEKQKDFLIREMNAMTFESRLCHGDFHLFNLIMTDHTVSIIDWVDSSSGDVRADVCRTYLLYLQYSSDLAAMYLELYCTKSGLPKSDILQWAPIIAGARLSENVSTEDSGRLIEIINHAYTK